MAEPIGGTPPPIDVSSDIMQSVVVAIGDGQPDGVPFIMRGRDTTLDQIIYWTSLTIDTAAALYGGPGPVVDITVSGKAF